jgi:stalled ribosome rescue protein Dom34
MPHYHVAVWIDHEHARVFSLSSSAADEWNVRPADPPQHLHHKAGKGDAGKAAPDQHYFHSVAEAVKDAGEILIVGPGIAKSELKHHLDRHDPAIAAKVVAVEALDHPSDGQLVAFARKFFHAEDRFRATAAPDRKPRG